MTLEEIKNHFGTARNFMMKTGMCHSNFHKWQKKGYVPRLTQQRIEEITQGLLKADNNPLAR